MEPAPATRVRSPSRRGLWHTIHVRFFIHLHYSQHLPLAGVMVIHRAQGEVHPLHPQRVPALGLLFASIFLHYFPHLPLAGVQIIHGSQGVVHPLHPQRVCALRPAATALRRRICLQVQRNACAQ